MNKKFAIVLALSLIAIVCCAGCIDPQDPVDPVDPVVPVDPVDPVTPPVEPVVPAEEYSVFFMLNYDGAGAYSAETVTAGDAVSKPATPTRSGYTFKGWFTAAEGGAEYDFTQAVNADLTLYAQWSKKSSSSSGSSSSGSSTPTHTHSYDNYVSKNDGTHTKSCSSGDNTVTEDCKFSGFVCTLCNYEGTVYHISNLTDLQNFADLVNYGDSFSGKTVVLDADIDLADVEWTPISTFKGTFDGQEHTISNMVVSETECVGFFGDVVGTIKNLKIDGATVNGNHYVGAVAGYVYGTVSGCYVTNSEIDATPNEVTTNSGTSYDNGDKVGGIVGYLAAEPSATLSGCYVSGTSVSGYRDVGGLVGMVNTGDHDTQTASVTGNSVSDVTVTVDQTGSNSYGYKTPNAGTIVGRIDADDVPKVTLSSNTESGVTVTVKLGNSEGGDPIVAYNGANAYTSLNEAISAATDGDTITVLPVTIDEFILYTSRDKSFTILGANAYNNPNGDGWDSESETILNGGMYIGSYSSSTVDKSITVKGITFKKTGLNVAGLKSVTIENNKFVDIDTIGTQTNDKITHAIHVHEQNYNDLAGSVSITNNYIKNVTIGCGINLLRVHDVTITGNTIDDVKSSSIVLQGVNTGKISIHDNILKTWGTSEGRAVRISMKADTPKITFTGNTMINDNAPEEFVKITGASAVEIGNKNNWNNKDVNPVVDYVTGSTLYLLTDSDTKVTVNGVTQLSAEQIAEKLSGGEDVTLKYDVQTTTTATGYGCADIVLNGGTFDGNGNTLSVDGSGDYSAIVTTGGAIQNLIIDNGFRGIFLKDMTADVYIDNAHLGGDGVCYCINTGTNTGDYSLIVTNSELRGWTSFDQIKSASFTNCKFGQGTYYNDIYGRVLKPYVNTELIECSFIEHMNLDLTELVEGHKITIKYCTVNGQAVTADVFTVPTTGAEYDTELFTVDLPSWATSINDCIVFE